LTKPTNPASPSLTSYLNQLDGTLDFNQGKLISNLKTPFGSLQGTSDLKQLVKDATTFLGQSSGTLNLLNGTASGTINLAGKPATGSFNFADFVGNYLSSLIKEVKGPQPFERGVLKLNVPTPFGAIVGTVDFGTGKLITDLDSPIGKLKTTIDLPDTLAFPFTVSGLNGEVNLGKGQVSARVPLIGPITVPISSLSGSFDFNAGQVKINVPIPGINIPINTSVDLAKIVDDAVTSALTTAKGTLTIANSKLGIDLTSSFGALKGTVDVAQLLKTYEPILTQAQGRLTFKSGVLTSTVVAPTANLKGTVNYGKLLT
jgi:hypothetical protein